PFGGDQFWTRRRLFLVDQREARIALVFLPCGVGVVVDPARQAQAEVADEGTGRALEMRACREGEVERDHAPRWRRRGKLLGRVDEDEAHGHVANLRDPRPICSGWGS